MKLQKTPKGQYYLTVPTALVRSKRWDKGQVLDIIINKKGNLEIVEEK